MLLAVGIIIVFVSCIGGFMLAGGSPITLVHPGEIMIICGIGLGILVVSSPKSVLVGLKNDLVKAFKGGVANKGKFIDLLVLLYELFMLGRRKGTPALDEHVSDPQNSSIFTKYPSFLNDKGLVEFLCNSLRPDCGRSMQTCRDRWNSDGRIAKPGSGGHPLDQSRGDDCRCVARCWYCCRGFGYY